MDSVYNIIGVPQGNPSGIADEQVQLLGSVSRIATLDDITKWNVTKTDTLSALMKTDDGTWEATKVQYFKLRRFKNINIV